MGASSMVAKYARCVFFVFNALFWLLGWASLVVGLWLYVVKRDYAALTPVNYGAMSAAGLCMAAGATVVVIAFVGCCGVGVRSRCLLLTYVVFVTLILLVELTAAAMGASYHDEVTDAIHAEMLAHLNSANVVDDGGGAHITWDRLQSQFACCGVDGYEDWYKSDRWPHNDWVPDSCCDAAKFPSGVTTNCGKMHEPSLWYQREGCFDAFSYWLLEHMHIVAIIGLLFSIVQVFVLAASILLYCEIGRRRETSLSDVACAEDKFEMDRFI